MTKVVSILTKSVASGIPIDIALLKLLLLEIILRSLGGLPDQSILKIIRKTGTLDKIVTFWGERGNRRDQAHKKSPRNYKICKRRLAVGLRMDLKVSSIETRPF